MQGGKDAAAGETTEPLRSPRVRERASERVRERASERAKRANILFNVVLNDAREARARSLVLV